MRRVFLVLLAALLTSPQVSSKAPPAKVSVVTTLTDLSSIAAMVGGDRVETFAIAAGYQNPHFVDPKPSYILKLSRADLFVTVGLDLESGWVPPLLNSARNSSIQPGGKGYVDASTGIPLLQIPSSVSRDQGDIHVYGNPHYWLDPDRGHLIAQNIFEGLVRIQPESRAYFEANLASFNAALDTKIAGWKAAMAPYAGTRIMAHHNEWPYFETAFGLQIVDFLEPKPGIPPTPSQLARVIGEMKRENISIIIISPYFNADAAKLVESQVGGKLVTLASSVGAFKGIDTYFDLFDYNVAQMIGALSATKK